MFNKHRTSLIKFGTDFSWWSFNDLISQKRFDEISILYTMSDIYVITQEIIVNV